jgi:hypothetical protein
MRFYYLIRVLSTQYQVSTGNESCVPESAPYGHLSALTRKTIRQLSKGCQDVVMLPSIEWQHPRWNV